jgi:DNA-binding LacI/PurR family transcriptional regulator
MRQRRVTIADVAREAGVSTATVSFVLNGRGGAVAISETTQATVRAVAARLGYTPNHAARSLRSRRTGIITLLISSLINPYFTSIATAIGAAVGRRGYELNIIDVSDNEAKLQALEHLRGGYADGAIIATGYRSTQGVALDVVQDLARNGLPVVLVLDRSPAPGIPAIRIDNEYGPYLATSHLLRLGHQSVAFLSVAGTHPLDQEGTSKADRYHGYWRALDEADVPFEPRWVLQGAAQTAPVGRELMHALLALPAPRPTAAVTFNDPMALGALRALYEAGVRAPEEMAVVGFGGIEQGQYSNPALTTIAHQHTGLGQQAVEMLFDLLAGRAVTDPERIMPVELLVRESCGAPPATRAGPVLR